MNIKSIIIAVAMTLLKGCGGGTEGSPVNASATMCEGIVSSATGRYDPETQTDHYCVYGESMVFDRAHNTWSVHSTNALHVGTWRAFEFEGGAYLVGSGEYIGPADDDHTYAVCSRNGGIDWIAGEC